MFNMSGDTFLVTLASIAALAFSVGPIAGCTQEVQVARSSAAAGLEQVALPGSDIKVWQKPRATLSVLKKEESK